MIMVKKSALDLYQQIQKFGFCNIFNKEDQVILKMLLRMVFYPFFSGLGQYLLRGTRTLAMWRSNN
jgi:hypothetical protein